MLAEIIQKVAGMEKEERQPYYPRPSAAGPERCIRQMVYHGSKTPLDKGIGDRYILTIDDSTFHEYLTHDWIAKTAYQIHSTQMGLNLDMTPWLSPGAVILFERRCPKCEKIIPANTLHGHGDGVLTDLIGTDWGYEHKAINRYAFERYIKLDFPLDYVAQSCIYNRALRADLPDLRKTLILVKCKDTARYLDMILDYDFDTDTGVIDEITLSSGEKKIAENGKHLLKMENVVGDSVRKFFAVWQHIDNGTLPERPFEIGTDFPCGYCGWEETCFAGYEKEYQELKEDVTLEGDVVDLCRLYLEEKMHEQNAASHKEELQEKIKAVMKKSEARKGKTGKGVPGDYTVTLSLRKRASYDMDKIPAGMIALAKKESSYEQLSIRKIQEPKKRR